MATDCQIGFAGRGPVPYSSILAYTREERLTPREARYFKLLVRELDEERFEHEATHRSQS